MSAALIPTIRVAKPWGRDDLPAQFDAPAGERIGEVWFEPPAALEAVLVKYLFTSEALSVQAHPSDQNSPNGRGKEECWLILSAEPGAKLALGLRDPVSEADLRAAALDGTIESMLAWHEVAAGDFFYVPAGTIHAIGAGLTLVEVQQNCGLTYRLYDYGRPRELHLDEAVGVALRGPYAPSLHRKIDPAASALLVDGPHFRVAHIAGAFPAELASAFPGAVQIVPLAGSVTLAGQVIGEGQSGWASSAALVAAENGVSRWLVCAPAE